MNILHVVQAYYPFQEKGGPVFKVRALAETLARRNHQVTVLTADLGLHNYPELAGNIAKSSKGSRLGLNNVQIVYLSTLAKYRAMTINPGLLQFAANELDAVDVIHFFGLYDLFGPVISHFARSRGIPYVVEPMGMYRPIDRNLAMKRLWHRALGRTFLTRASRILATSQIEQTEILDAGFPAPKVLIRWNGIESNPFATRLPPGSFRSKWNLPPDVPLISFLSRLIPRKGADLLIDAFAEACPQSGRLVIAGPEGEPGYRAYLEARAASSGLRERVVFTGPLYGDEKQSLYSASDIFVLPSRYENFANVVAEAMVWGVPVIVSESCGISSLVAEERAGLLIKPEKQEISRAIQTLLTDKPLRERLKQGCARVLARLDWETLATEMERCYESIIPPTSFAP